MTSTAPAKNNSTLPERVVLTDVSARDGLQSVDGFVEPLMRAQWVAALLDAGIDEAEAASFVNPRRVPQMARAGEVLRALGDKHAERVWSLVPNRRGLREATASGARNVICFVSATESHSRANLGVSVAGAMEELKSMALEIHREGQRSRVALSVAWTDPEEGEVPLEASAGLVRKFADFGFKEVTLCDTHGGATPEGVAGLIDAVAEVYRPESLGLHFHDTFGNASANAMAGLLAGVARIDGSILGLGGCPFIAGAKGNLDMAALVGMIEGLNIAIGTNSEKIGVAARECGAILKGRRSA